jgi:hypothetical protein
MRRRSLLMAGLAAGCTNRPQEPPGPSTVEGAPRRILVVELVRRAHVADDRLGLIVSACVWHVSPGGALYGDHWGWCEDFKILPRSSPGYLLQTTQFSGGASGGYSRLAVLPPMPAALDAFGHRVTLRTASSTTGSLQLEFGAAAATLAPGETAALGTGQALIEPPEDTGHFEPGFDQPIAAHVTYAAVHHGWLDSRRISGRALRSP